MAAQKAKNDQVRKEKLKAEVELKKAEEKALMNFKLGISDDLIQGCQDVKQVLEAVRNQFLQKQAEKAGFDAKAVTANQKASSLSVFEIKELTQRTNTDGAQAVVNPSDIVLEEDDPEQIL